MNLRRGKPKYRPSPSAQRLFRLVSYWWGFRMTPEGRTLAACILIVGPVASLSLDIPVYELLSSLTALVLVSYSAAWVLRPRVELEGQFPEKAVAGQAIAGAFTVTNRSRFAARSLTLGAFGLPPALRLGEGAPPVARLAPGAAASVQLTIEPLRRGMYMLNALTLYSTFPFQLFRTPARATRRCSPVLCRDGLLVYPRFTPLADIDVPVSARYQPGGIALSSHVGESPEYIGNREYQPGDSTRHLDHRSWARLAVPVVREYREEYYCRVALVLDTFVPEGLVAGPEGFPDLEAAVSISAAIADVLARGEYIIDLFAAGPELYVFRSGRHTALFDNVLEILACVEACRANPFAKVTPALRDELGSTSSLIGVFLDWDTHRAALARAAAEAGCSVKVIIVRDGPTSLPCASAEPGTDISQYSPEAIRRGGLEAL